jgi:hypothetical protein
MGLSFLCLPFGVFLGCYLLDFLHYSSGVSGRSARINRSQSNKRFERSRAGSFDVHGGESMIWINQLRLTTTRAWTSQDSVDTSASSSSSFEFLGTYASQMTMAASRIVE